MRMRFEVYCIFAFYAVIIYSFVAHWVRADGWLQPELASTQSMHPLLGVCLLYGKVRSTGKYIYPADVVNGKFSDLLVRPYLRLPHYWSCWIHVLQ